MGGGVCGGYSWLPASFQQQHCSMSICPLPGKLGEHARQHDPQKPLSSLSNFKIQALEGSSALTGRIRIQTPPFLACKSPIPL